MKEIMYVEYHDRVVKFDLCKNYGIDPELQLGDKPLPRMLSMDDFYLDYEFLLQFLPIELWLKIFKINYEESMIDYRDLVSCEIEYNIHRLFKMKRYNIDYKDFFIKINVSPTLFQFYSTMYNEKDVREFYGYSAYICHSSLDKINSLSDYLPRFTKCRTVMGGTDKDDKWSLNITTDYMRDFVFSDGGFNCDRIINRLNSYKRQRKIKTFKTIPYYTEICKSFIDNFYCKKNRIRNTYRH